MEPGPPRDGAVEVSPRTPARRLTALLALLVLGGGVLHSQSAPPFTLNGGDPVQVRLTGDTAWREADITIVGPCLTFTFESDKDAEGGFRARSFRGATAVRRVDRSGLWHSPSAQEWQELQGCRVASGAAPLAPPSECGPRPDLARQHTLEMLASIRRMNSTGQPSDDLRGVKDGQVSPVMSASLCRDLLGKMALDMPSTDTIPFEGIMDLGGLGYVVSHSPLVRDPNAKGWITTTYLDAEHMLVRVSNQTMIGAPVR